VVGLLGITTAALWRRFGKRESGPRYRTLPRGLQKKLARTGQLPPGYRRGVVDGHAVIFDDRTHVLLDVAVLF
jgi:hypothetical protein